jgi:hypothetical protein
MDIHIAACPALDCGSSCFTCCDGCAGIPPFHYDVTPGLTIDHNNAITMLTLDHNVTPGLIIESGNAISALVFAIDILTAFGVRADPG